jgi:hypothetical protein
VEERQCNGRGDGCVDGCGEGGRRSRNEAGEEKRRGGSGMEGQSAKGGANKLRQDGWRHKEGRKKRFY